LRAARFRRYIDNDGARSEAERARCPAARERRESPAWPRQGDDLAVPHLKELIVSSLFDRAASPPRIGRYTLLRLLGEGGMGVVYAAYDEDLDRKVAIKLLRAGSSPPPATDGDPATVGEARARLVREAQALAKFNHPHIVAIHDVGAHRGAVWLAMEYVDGVTLSAWSKRRRRTWREVLAVMTPVALGLSAAHDAGLVHRDIKPDNIMIGNDGRVRVMDLGLARALDDGEAATGEFSADAASAGARHLAVLAARMTRAGAVVGTPAYMSPEQFQGEPVDARADVFSFCVTLWEALMGERPFAGRTLTELWADVLAGKVRPVPRDPQSQRVPGWLRSVCLQGLAAAPGRRFDSMNALLDALSRGRSRARARRWLAGAVAAGAVAGAVALYQQHDRAGRIAACEDAGARIFDVWSDEARAGVRAGLVATGRSYAPVTADKVMPLLDAQADAWREHRTRACLQADVEGTFDAEQLDRAVWCLDERRMELATMVDELVHADATIVQTAVSAATELLPVSPCTDEKVLAALPSPPPADAREQVDAVRTALSQAGTLLAAGRYPRALELTRSALVDAQTTGWPPVLVSARRLEGVILQQTGAFAEAETASVAAYVDAAKLRAWDVAAQAAIDLVATIGIRQARHAEAKVWAKHAEVAISFAGDPLELSEAIRLTNLASVHWNAGEYAEAKALYERSMALEAKALGPGHPDEADALSSLALVHHAMGEYAEARPLFERALAIAEEAFGAEHPDVATHLQNLAGVHFVTGGYAEAKALYGRALALVEEALGPEHPRAADALTGLAGVHWATGGYAEAKTALERVLIVLEKALGPEHPSFAECLNNLGSVHFVMGEHAEAKALFERALALREKTLGAEHPSVAECLNNLGGVRYAVGEYAEAKALFERSLAMREKALGAEHPSVAESLDNLAEVHAQTGAYAEAKPLYERALALRKQAFGAEHPDVAVSLAGLGSVALAQGHAAEALPLLEQAVAIFDAHEGVQHSELKTRFGLARALVLAGGDRTRALAEARKAADGLREAGEGEAKLLVEVEAFLADHGAVK
jgi:tetratricopeptide (TPR) repeat protein